MGFAQDFPPVPNPPRLVNDFTQTLSQDEVSRLERKLVAYNDSTSTQIAIVMIRSIGQYDISDYAFQLGDRSVKFILSWTPESLILLSRKASKLELTLKLPF